MELKGGTGPILHMVSFGDFLEAYKADKTFRVRSPNAVDPTNTDPNAPWIVLSAADVGCAHPIVSRSIIQSRTFLNEVMTTRTIDREAVLAVLYRAKEGLLSCEAAMVKLHQAVNSIVESVQAQGVQWSKNARAINPFPHVNDLEALGGDFLVKANRQIRTICELVGCFVDMDRKHSNFDHLHKELETKLGPQEFLTRLVGENKNFIRRIVELRNFDEHSSNSRTVFHNFQLGPAPDYSLLNPSWEVLGGVTHPREDMCRDSHLIVGSLLELTEWSVIYGVMQWRNPVFGQYVREIEEGDVDQSCPIFYRPELDYQALFMKQLDSGKDGG